MRVKMEEEKKRKESRENLREKGKSLCMSLSYTCVCRQDMLNPTVLEESVFRV